MKPGIFLILALHLRSLDKQRHSQRSLSSTGLEFMVLVALAAMTFLPTRKDLLQVQKCSSPRNQYQRQSLAGAIQHGRIREANQAVVRCAL